MRSSSRVAGIPSNARSALGSDGERQEAGALGVVERLDAERVARRQEELTLRIPEHQGEDTDQLVHEGLAPTPVGGQHELGVLGFRSRAAGCRSLRAGKLGAEPIDQLRAIVQAQVRAESYSVRPHLRDTLEARSRRAPQLALNESNGSFAEDGRLAGRELAAESSYERSRESFELGASDHPVAPHDSADAAHRRVPSQAQPWRDFTRPSSTEP